LVQAAGELREARELFEECWELQLQIFFVATEIPIPQPSEGCSGFRYSRDWECYKEAAPMTISSRCYAISSRTAIHLGTAAVIFGFSETPTYILPRALTEVIKSTKTMSLL